MNRPGAGPGPSRGDGLRPGFVQVYGSWRESLIPPEASDNGEAWTRLAAETAARGGSAAAVFEVHEPADQHPATLDAMLTRHAERLPLLIEPKGLKIGLVPLLLDHLEVLATIDEMAIAGDAVEFTAWVPTRYTERLQARRGVSPGIRVHDARLLDLGGGVRIVMVSKAEVFEVSATDGPLRPRTVFMVGDLPSVRFFGPRRGERTVRAYDPTARFQAVDDEGAAAIALREQQQAAREAEWPGRVRLAGLGRP